MDPAQLEASNQMSNTVTLAQSITESPCECPTHATVLDPANIKLRCKWEELPVLTIDSKIFAIDDLLVEIPEFELETLFEAEGFSIEKYVDEQSLRNSWVWHYCPSKHWKVIIVDEFLLTEGVCQECYAKVPAGVIALWKMHNWEFLQTYDPPAYTSPVSPFAQPQSASKAEVSVSATLGI